jgi:hypothetical protein
MQFPHNLCARLRLFVTVALKIRPRDIWFSAQATKILSKGK